MPPAFSRSAYLAWAAVCLLWGTTYLAIRVSLETIPPLLMAGSRWTVAGSIILAALKIRGEPIPPRSHWPALTLLGILLMGFGNGCVVWAEQGTLILGEPLSPRLAVAGAVVLAGMSLVRDTQI